MTREDGYMTDKEMTQYKAMLKRKSKPIKQESCEDAISRKLVLGEYGIYNNESLRKRIESMPSVQPKSRWIPCSERLPKTNKDLTELLVTVNCKTWNKPSVLSLIWENTTIRGKKVSRWKYCGQLLPPLWKPIAWMPLPDPYKESKE